jgi:hypothetical protein
MKRLNFVCLLVTAVALLFYGCGKEGPTGPEGPAGPAGPTAQWYDFSLVFNDTITSGYFSLYAHTNYQDNDAVITYWKADSVTFVQMPYTFYDPGSVPVYFFSVIDESYGQPWLWVLTQRADSTALSPWTSRVVCNFRAVVIKTTAGKSPPRIDYGNYQEVKRYYALPD